MYLCFERLEPILEGFANADMTSDLDGRKYTSKCFFYFCKGSISWQSKLQKCVALPPTKAKYVVIEAKKEML